MNQGKYIFAQLTDFLPRRVFDRIVEQYDGNKYVKSFKCWNQLLCMVFGQLTARDSMRYLMLSLEAHKPKYYHLGFGSKVTRRNLGKANERRNCKIFEEFAYILIEEARRSCSILQQSTSVLVSSGGLSSAKTKEESNFTLFMMQKPLYPILFTLLQQECMMLIFWILSLMNLEAFMFLIRDTLISLGCTGYIKSDHSL